MSDWKSRAIPVTVEAPATSWKSRAEPIDVPQENVDPSITESVLRGAAQGATFGNADELAGLLESLTGGKTYEQARNESRANYKAAEQANPIASTVGNLGGGLATALIPGLGALGMGKGVLGAAKMGALYGGASAIGSSEQDLLHPSTESVGNLGKEVLHGAELGAASGAVMGGVAKGVGKLVKNYKSDKLGKEIIDAYEFAKADPEFNTPDFYVKQAEKTRDMAEQLHGKVESDISANVNAAYESAKNNIKPVPVKEVMSDLLKALSDQPAEIKLKTLQGLEGIGKDGMLGPEDLITLKNSLKNSAQTFGFTSQGNPNANPELYKAYNAAAEAIEGKLQTPEFLKAQAMRSKQGDIRAKLDSEISGTTLDEKKLSKENAVDSLKNSALKNQSEPAVNEAIRYRKGTEIAGELQRFTGDKPSLVTQAEADAKSHKDYMGFLDNFNNNVRKEHISKQARDTSYLATNTTNFLSTMGRSAKGKGMLAASAAGDVARGYNNLVDRMMNAPSNFLETLGGAMIKAGKPAGNVLLKAASQPEAKRKAVLFSLMQQPGIREMLQEHIDNPDFQK